jgi:hypothetical protein
MKTVFTNDELFHRWAQAAEGDYGRNSNDSLSFDGGSLYSYSTEIARIERIRGERVVFFSNNKFTMTIARHLSKAMRATTHLENFEALASYNMPLVTNTRALLDSYALDIFILLDLASRDRSMKPYHLSEAAGKAERMNRLISLTRARPVARHRDAIKVAQSGDIEKAVEIEELRRKKRDRKEKRDQRKRESSLRETVKKWRDSIEAYWLNGKRHREESPAYIGNNYEAYYQNGELHRDEGPAIVNDEKLTKE